jgi:2OG-Fe(II) oxygenase superfamily
MRTGVEDRADTYPIRPEVLQARAQAFRESYARAEPFPHVVIDDFFPEPLLASLLEEFPSPGAIDWQRFDAGTEKKLASKLEEQLGDRTRRFIWSLNSQVFISFLETLTGIDGLIPDPHLWGGGLHQIVPGGFLKVHADFNRHERLRLDRRLNLLLYLNRDWKEEYGGHLQLWTRDMSRCVVKVLPVFNRCVVFSTTDFSYHGHPDPLTCPEGRTRKSLALYYYTNGRPAEELSGDHSTLFHPRPGEAFAKDREPHAFKSFVKDCIPPILLRTSRRLRGQS